jgi:hypothetical protein
MKSSRNEANKQSKQEKGNKPVPEIRDDMDSRHGQEDGYKDASVKKGNRSGKHDAT